MNIAFRINEIEETDNEWLAEIEILDTPKGKILKETINTGMRIVTMGVADTNKDKDDNYVVKNFRLVSVGIEPKENCA